MYLLPPESRENPDKILMVYEVIGISTSTRIKKKSYSTVKGLNFNIKF